MASLCRHVHVCSTASSRLRRSSAEIKAVFVCTCGNLETTLAVGQLGRLKALSPRENLPGSTDDNRDAQEPASSGGVDTTHSLPSSPARIAGRSTGKSTSAVERDTRLTRWPTDKQMLLFRRRTIARPADDVAPLLPDSGTKQPALCSSFPFKTRRHAQFVSESAKFLIVPTPLGAR